MVVFESNGCDEKLCLHYLKTEVSDKLVYCDPVLSPGKGRNDAYLSPTVVLNVEMIRA